MNQTERQLKALQQQVAAETPMFTLEATQRRSNRYGLAQLQHWRVARHHITYAMTPLRPTHADMDNAQWQTKRSGDPPPSTAALRTMEAQFQELQPKAMEIFEQVTAPRRMMDAIHIRAGNRPQTTLAIQMQGVLTGCANRLAEIAGPWPRPMGLAAAQEFPTGETLTLQVPGYSYSKMIEWTGTPWGMYEQMEVVVAQLARWERMCQAITREMADPPLRRAD